MDGTQIDSVPCPYCREEGRDRSGDNLAVFEKEDGAVDGFCFSCKGGEGRYVKDPYGDGGKSDKTKVGIKKRKPLSSAEVETMGEIGTYPFRDLPDRHISEETCKHFGVRVGLSTRDGKTVTHHYYPDTKDGELCGWEVRDVAKKRFSAVGDRKGALDLWGSEKAKLSGGKKLYITEGRCDAMALYQCLRESAPKKWAHLVPAVVSLTRGSATGLKDLMANRKLLESFPEIVLVFDNDKPGEQAVEKILKSFPNCKVAVIPKLEFAHPETGEVKFTKDANDMYLGDFTIQLRDLVVFKADVVRQGKVLDVVDFIEDAMKKPERGIDWPWPTVTKVTYGLRPHNIHIIGAGPKIGKSDHEYECIQWFSMVKDQPVGVFDLENPPQKTAKKVASKFAGLDYTNPDSVYVDDDLRRHLMSLNGKVRFYDRGASRDWPDIRVAMEEMHLLDKISIFILDPLTALVSRYTSSEANDKLNEIMTDVADLVYKYPISLLIYTHVNPKQKGQKPHEKGAPVLTSEFTGSRAMEKWSHYAWGISRDRSPESADPDLSSLDLLFDRDFGYSARIPLRFNKDDMSYREAKHRLK
jgi:twinkle protein